MSIFLNARNTVLVLQLEVGDADAKPLVEVIEPYVRFTPHFVFDLEGIMLTSLRIGELMNAAKSVGVLWKSHFPGFGLINVTETSQMALKHVKLVSLFNIYPDLPAAVTGLTRADP